MHTYAKFDNVWLKGHSELNERWVQDRIADDPSILGLGDVILKDKERIQPRAGRLDLLLQDAEANHRYEVEIQLGSTDESHIIRTIEYWDIERKRYPQYEHTAVIVAETITARFLNVISLFNGMIPLVAVQMNALRFNDHIGLVFTKVLDQMTLGLVDEDEEVQETTDRVRWTPTIGQVLGLVKVWSSGPQRPLTGLSAAARIQRRIGCNCAQLQSPAARPEFFARKFCVLPRRSR
jgi:hypothetical protein